MEISQIYMYPIKSMGGISLTECELDRFGLKYDRRWMLVDKNGNFLTQRHHAKMCLFNIAIQDESLLITHKNDAKINLVVPFTPNMDTTLEVKVWDDVCESQLVDTAIDQELSLIFGEEVHLVLMPDHIKRQVDKRYAPEGSTTAFSDGYPLLMISEASLELLNTKLEHAIEMRRFRPNLVIKGGYAHCEDQKGIWQIGQYKFQAVKPCSRCVVTTINPDTSNKSPEPLRTLSSYRKQDGKVMFGMNMLHQNFNAKLKLGDKVSFLD